MTSVFTKMAYAQFSSLPQPSLQKARDKMMNSINLQSDQAALNSLSKLLNQIVNDNKFTENNIAEKILNRLPQLIDQESERAIQDLKITQNMKVYTEESVAAWSVYSSLAKNYKTALDNGINDLALSKQVDEAKSRALALQGRLSGLSGQAFESLLQVLLPLVKDNVQDVASTTVNELVQILDKTDKISTAGTKNTTISFLVDEEEVRISSQGKIDVYTESPFLGDSEILKISAKNYSKLRDIHLLKGGSVVGLISQWPIENNIKNYYYNALGVWHPDTYLQEARLLFNIQALAGKGDNDLANVLILNVQSRKNPISVISIKSLLQGIEANPIEGQSAFNMKFNSLPAYSEGEMRKDKKEFTSRLSKITLDTSLNKAYLQLKYISQLK